MEKKLATIAFPYNHDCDPNGARKTLDETIGDEIRKHPGVRNVTITVTAEGDDPSWEICVVTVLLLFAVPVISIAIGGYAGQRLLFSDIVVLWVYALAKACA